MEHVCQNCGHSTQSSSAPRFCSECGTRFGQPDVADAATIAPDTQLVHDMATMVPGPAPGPSDSGRDALPGFQIVRELGRGGMGVVYEAVDEATGRSVALKLLASGFDRDEEAVQRFLREGKIAASLSHPRSTFVYDAGEVDGRFFITMELMSGGTLKDIVDREGKLSVTQAVNHTIDMLDGLEAAHTVDVVHRDVKPSNSFVTSDGRVKVGDFGISKSLVSDASLTVTGAFMGTPQFAAPEQIRAGKIDNRTDLYSVGATLFYLLAGRAPFQGDAIQVVADIVSEPAPLLHSIESEVPEELSQIIARVMEKDPENRPQTAGELKLALL
ncbi:MAG: protein kinase, partial [Planctomycetaceae bacterium]